jgi:hypothetical protein
MNSVNTSLIHVSQVSQIQLSLKGKQMRQRFTVQYGISQQVCHLIGSYVRNMYIYIYIYIYIYVDFCFLKRSPSSLRATSYAGMDSRENGGADKQVQERILRRYRSREISRAVVKICVRYCHHIWFDVWSS